MANQMDPRPKLTVITVVKNDAEGLQKTLASLAVQSRRDAFECVVIDGASDDGTLDVIKANEAIVGRWISEPDRGIYDAMNKGVSMARGKLILFLNAGDYLYGTDTLTRFFDCYDRHDTHDLLFVCNVLTDAGRLKRPKFLWLKANYMLPTYHQGIIYPAALLREEPYSLQYQISADVHQFLRIRPRVRLVKCDMVLSVFDTTGVSSTNVVARDDEYHRIYQELGVSPFFRWLKHMHEIHERWRHRG